ncbi:hypothetical protein Tco_0496889 [Tanacetum coccineum]
MYTPAYVESETINQADRAQSSRVPVPLPDDPYVVVRHAQLVDTDTESDPEEASSKAEESQPLGSTTPLMSEEFEASKPSGTRTVSSHSLVSLDSTASLSPYHLLTHVSPTLTPTRVSYHRRTTCMIVRFQPAMSPGHSARVAEALALSDSAFPKSEGDELGDEDTEEDMEDESQGLDDESQGLDDESRGLDDDSQGLEDEGPGMEEEAALEGQQQAVLVVDTAASEPLGLGYRVARHRALESSEEIALSTYEVEQSSRSILEQDGTPPSPEWSLGSLPVSPSSPVVPSPIALLVATPATTISVDEDQFIEVGSQLELHESILYDHTQRLDVLPPTLVVDIDRDVRSCILGQEQLEMRSFCRVLALEAWAWHVDTRFANMSHARYDDHRLIHDMLVQQAAM